MAERYLEDFAAGQTFASARIRIQAEDIKKFAAEFDPQPFHLDESAAAGSMFRGLVASGWHTAAVTMRLLVDSDIKPAGGLVGAGLDELRWPRPVQSGPETSSGSKAKCSRHEPRNPVPTTESSRCGRRR